MCAIAGVLDLNAGGNVPEKMLATMVRRGPDGSGVFTAPGCSLLHTRLAVVDPAGGAQPMELGWEGEHYTLVYNGELYNTAELRRRLEALGHSFRTRSDTEVVLHGYAQWGRECVEHFNGIFALAVWEGKKRRLFLARDRIGVKPLFYSLHRGGMIFASEIKTILAYPTVEPCLDAQGAAEILLLGPGRTPGCGVFRGIQELEPGCRGYYGEGRFRAERYWCLTDGEHRDSFRDTVEKVRWLVTDAITRQLVSDVPVGAFLSGGLDSSIICAVCARDLAQRGERLDTFSVDYVDQQKHFVPGKFQPNSDTQYIGTMQQALNSRQHWTVLSPGDLEAALEDATHARDLPGMADVDFSLLAFCADVRREVKVALSGECADEIFGGYPWYRDPQVRAREGFPWAQSGALRISLLRPGVLGSADPMEYIRSRYAQTCADSDILPGTPPEERRMKEMVNLNFRWFMQTLLERKDRMSMYSGLEVRVPFCDWRIAQYLYRVPWEYKDHQGVEKGLLRQALGELLPVSVRERKKSPYPKTHDPAYARAMERRLRALLARKDAPLFALADPAAVEGLLSCELRWPWYGQLMARPQILAYLLQVNYWLESYKIKLNF